MTALKVLFIGGTGTISSACSQLALERGVDLFLLDVRTADGSMTLAGRVRTTFTGGNP